MSLAPDYRHRWSPCWASAFVVMSVCLVPARDAGAQTVQVQAGSSSLYGAHGASVETRGRSSSVTFGAGRVHDRFTVGGLFRKATRGIIFSVGDETVDFALPTDMFGGGHYVPVRAAGVELTRGRLRYKALAGGASTSLGAPFFRGAEWGDSLGLLFVDGWLTPRVRVVSRNVFSNTASSIHGLEWHPKASLTLAGAAGVGANKPYTALSAAVERRWVSATAAHVSGRSAFRRINLDSPASSEVTGENLSVTVHPQEWWSMSAARQNLLDASEMRPTARQVKVDRFGLTLNRLGFRTGLNLYESRGEQLNTTGLSLSVARHVTQAFDVSVDFLRAKAEDVDQSGSVVAILQERLHPRVSLLQMITRSDNATSMNFGGQFLSNPLTVSVSYQNVYAPFRIGNPFVQVLGIDLRLQVFDSFQLQAGTFTTPDGRLRYTIAGASVVSLAGGSHDRATTTFKFPKYVIRGRVVDSEGRPIAGAALQIGKDVILTDQDGRFFLRSNKLTPTSLEVLVDEFIIAGRFQVVTAPAKATPVPVENPTEIPIVVRRR